MKRRGAPDLGWDWVQEDKVTVERCVHELRRGRVRLFIELARIGGHDPEVHLAVLAAGQRESQWQDVGQVVPISAHEDTEPRIRGLGCVLGTRVKQSTCKKSAASVCCRPKKKKKTVDASREKNIKP